MDPGEGHLACGTITRALRRQTTFNTHREEMLPYS